MKFGRAEIGARGVYLAGLTDPGFTDILGPFPLVDPSVKAAALETFRAGDGARMQFVPAGTN